MLKKKQQTPVNQETLPEDRVLLKTMLGISPRTYLAVLYAFGVLAILFFVLLYPGISTPGSVLVIKSDPHGAAVRIDDVYYDITPCSIFVPAGEHQVEVLVSGFDQYRTTMQVGSRLFASLLFPRRVPVTVQLSVPDPVAALSRQAAEYAAWSFAGEPTATYQVPQVLSEGVYRLGKGAAPALNEVLASAARFTVTRAGLRDLNRAHFLLDNAGNAASPASAVRSINNALAWLSRTPGAAAWLATVVPPETAAIITDSAWFKKRVEKGALEPVLGRTITVESLAFREVLAGERTFWIAETAVPALSWDTFVKARPEWAPEHTQELIAQKVVDAGYRETVGTVVAVSGVSWYAGQAYGQWLTGQLPPELSGWAVRLPTEAEWEQAMVPDMLGDLWEWCLDSFAPVDFLPAPVPVESPEKSVRGGSWLDRAGSVGISRRGGLPPEFCSPFVSFRLVIVHD
jgi:hypothetical protein